METRALGSQGLTVSAQGLGCMGMSQAYGQPDEAGSIATLHRALELGVTFWDTANVYGDDGPGGFGANEVLLAKVLAERRDEVTLATKMGINGVATEGGISFSLSATPDDVRRRCEESLERLGTDHIDLYYLHRVDPETPIEETIGAMGDLVQAGKVRYVGVSEVTAEQRGVRPGQVALAWVHARGEDVVPIPGTKRIEYLEQNVAALDVTLTADELDRLDGLAAKVAGTRY